MKVRKKLTHTTLVAMCVTAVLAAIGSLWVDGRSDIALRTTAAFYLAMYCASYPGQLLQILRNMERKSTEGISIVREEYGALVNYLWLLWAASIMPMDISVITTKIVGTLFPLIVLWQNLELPLVKERRREQIFAIFGFTVATVVAFSFHLAKFEIATNTHQIILIVVLFWILSREKWIAVWGRGFILVIILVGFYTWDKSGTRFISGMPVLIAGFAIVRGRIDQFRMSNIDKTFALSLASTATYVLRAFATLLYAHTKWKVLGDAGISTPLALLGIIGFTSDGIILGQIYYWRLWRKGEYLEQIRFEENR